MFNGIMIYIISIIIYLIINCILLKIYINETHNIFINLLIISDKK
jgi:hypothetical protein